MNEDKSPSFETPLTRRSFFKLAGLAVGGLAAGYVAGKLGLAPAGSGLTLQAFLPYDAELIYELTAGFWRLAGRPGKLQASGSESFVGLMQAAAGFNPYSSATGLAGITPLEQPVAADLVLSDRLRGIYDPRLDFPAEIAAVRQKISGRLAGLAVSLSLVDFAGPGPRRAYAVIHGTGGVVERLDLRRSFDDIWLDGPFGRTCLRVADGQVWVQSASCRNRLCQQVGRIGLPGQHCACAPNRLMIEIEAG